MRYLSLIVLSIFLFGCHFNFGVTPFNFTDIKKSNDPLRGDMLKFIWDGDRDAVNYSVCIKDTTQLDDCRSIADVRNVSEAFVRLSSVVEQSTAVFFILGKDCVSSYSSNEMTIPAGVINSLVQYIKSPNTDPNDNFGYAVALSADGKTLAVGALKEDSNAKTINGDLLNNDLLTSGAVYIYRFDGRDWLNQAYIKASNSGANDEFGNAIALNANGTVLIVGAQGEASNGTGINGAGAADDSAARSGAVYVYRLDEKMQWNEEAYIKAAASGLDDLFGSSVSINAIGDVFSAGARGEDSNLIGVNPTEAMNNSAVDSGAAYLFRFTGLAWEQEAYLKASNPDVNDAYGQSVSLSADGKTLAIGAAGESSNAIVIDGLQSDNSAVNSGAAYLYRYDGAVWAQQAYMKSSNAQTSDFFGASLSLSSNGNTLGVGGRGESSNAMGVNGDQANNTTKDAGAAYVFLFNAGAWTQEAYLKASNTGANDRFGYALSLTSDGNSLYVGAIGEASLGTVIDGQQLSDDEPNAGAMYVFRRDKGAWAQYSYVKSPNTQRDDLFGSSLALNANADVVAVGAIGESSNAIKINGNQLDNSAVSAGAVYIY